MAINPDIPLGVQIQPVNLLKNYGEALQIRGLLDRQKEEEQQRRLREQQIQSATLENESRRRAIDEEGAYKGILLESNGDLPTAYKLATQRGINPKVTLQLQKEIDEQATRQSTRDKASFELDRSKRSEIADRLNVISQLQTPEEQKQAVDAANADWVNRKVLTPDQVEEYQGPQWIKQRLAQVNTIKQIDELADAKRKQSAEERAAGADKRAADAAAQALINAKTEGEQKARILTGTSPVGVTAEQQAQLDATAAREKAAEADRAASRAITVRGQNMVDQRTRELNDINRENKPPTAAQSTVATYAARLKQSNDILDGISQGGVERFYNQHVPDFASFMRTDKGQSFDQAQRDFINATLRRESGAVINKDEFKNAERQYLPQPGDSAAVLRQKKNNRTIVMESFKRASGKAYVDPQELLNQTRTPLDEIFK